MTGEMFTFADPDRAPLEAAWNWDGRMPRGHVVLIAGWRESAKGLVACNLAGAMTTGRPLPGETEAREPGDVVMICAEDDACEDLAWRLRAAGADLERVHDLSSLPDGSPFELSASKTSPGNVPELLAYLRMLRDEGRNPRLVVLDPLNALVMDGSIKTDQGARRVIGRLERVAQRTGVTIAVVHHFVKSGAIGGSQGLVDAPRWVYEIREDPMSPEYKILHLAKCNVAAAEDLRYKIIRDGHDSRIEWVERADVERETRAWRPRPAPATVVPLDGNGIPARRLARVWLQQTGGGSAEECAEATGLLVDVAREALDGLAAEGIVGTGRKLSLRRG
jgi:hypothetical protein